MGDIPLRHPGRGRILNKIMKGRSVSMDVKDMDVLDLLDAATYQRIVEERRGSFRICDDGSYSFVLWATKISKQEEKAVPKSQSVKDLEAMWKALGGPIRDQLCHILCWAFAGGDLVSILCVMCKDEDAFIPLSAWFLCHVVAPRLLRSDTSVGLNHHCYGCFIKDALQFIARSGCPKEEKTRFDCRKKPPPTQVKKKFKINRVLNFRSRLSLLKQVNLHHVGAALIVFDDMWKSTPDYVVYEGPKSPRAEFECYHSVVVLGVGYLGEKLMAFCKLSNGTETATGGYLCVSLEVKILVVAVRLNLRENVHTPEPSLFLTDFHYPEMKNNKLMGKRKSESTTLSKQKKSRV